MGEHSRYNVGGDEVEMNGVLKNKLGVSDKERLENIETLLLNDSYGCFTELLRKGKIKFDVKLIFDIHKYFLSSLYFWAGKIRTVEISKNNILFCASSQISKELDAFDKILAKNIPTITDRREIVSSKLAIIHCEFNAIHPFREGNGRAIRLFLDLLALSVGFDVINYDANSKKDYIKACVWGMSSDYSKMKNIIYKGLINNVNHA
ncbi:MAG: Fic family protein [Candidatus Gracilibacteria bacterium]